MALNNKQQAFVSEYLTCWNASEAARRAGYNGQANVVGPRMLANVSIKAEISQRLKEKHLSADEVLYRLAEQARGEHSAYLLPNGTVNYGAILEDGKGHLIHKVKQTKYGNEIEFYDAQAALVHLGRAHGMFADRVEVSGKVELGHTVDQALKTAWGNGPKEPDANNSDD